MGGYGGSDVGMGMVKKELVFHCKEMGERYERVRLSNGNGRLSDGDGWEGDGDEGMGMGKGRGKF